MTPPRVWAHLTNAAAKMRDLSAQKLRSAQSRRQEAQRKLDALLGYRQDYLAKLDAATRKGIGADGLRNYRAFLANLDRAIEQQTALMSTMHTDVGFAQTDWMHTQRRVDSLQTIEERRAEIGERIEARRDQKLTDEFALRRNRGGGSD
ncbi:MAG: flagellar export protein FliJ [Betaproteobacteria bacterium]